MSRGILFSKIWKRVRLLFGYIYSDVIFRFFFCVRVCVDI